MKNLIEILDRFEGKKTLLVSALLSIRPEMKLTTSHLNNWISRDFKVPDIWVLPLSEVTQWEITPHELRPDIYPHPHDGLPDELRCNIEKNNGRRSNDRRARVQSMDETI